MFFPADLEGPAFERWVSSIEKPAILSRSEWGAKPPMQPWKEHHGRHITIHHAGVATNRSRTFAQMLVALQGFSQRVDQLAGGRTKPAWPDIPYHWYIGWQGGIADCRDPKIVGDTNTEYDPTGHLLVCLEGNFEDEEPTGAQIRALDAIVTYLVAQYRVHPDLIKSHRDFATTSCPGSKLYRELPRIRERIALRLRCAGVELTENGSIKP
ncbi:MAG TPA: peptidoglycan recognition family protein [Fimbriimonadaceae bacterium]|nr:peptidoglycan recognition family protein [Fimbriimonadaceae bacterium]